MTAQDFRDGPARVEISAPIGYTRAVGPTPADPAPGGPARAIFADDQDTATDQDGPAGPVWMPTPTPEEEAYPLRARGAGLRTRYHRQHADAATPCDELAALTDYVRAALVSADRAKMRHPVSAGAVRAAIRAMRDAGDTLTAAMRDWSPES